MFYNIERTLEFLPYVAWWILALTLVIFEVKNFKDMVIDRPKADPGRGGFIPPSGEGKRLISCTYSQPRISVP